MGERKGFKVGQQVRCMDPHHGLERGRVYKVTREVPHRDPAYDCIYVEGLMEGFFANRFEAVREEPLRRFRVGDRVRLMTPNPPLVEGAVYPVTRVRLYAGCPGQPMVGVRGPNHHGVLTDDLGCFEDSLQLVERQTFLPGDRVRVLRSGRHVIEPGGVGNTATVLELSPWTPGCVMVRIDYPADSLYGAHGLNQEGDPSDFWPLEHEGTPVHPAVPTLEPSELGLERAAHRLTHERLCDALGERDAARAERDEARQEREDVRDKLERLVNARTHYLEAAQAAEDFLTAPAEDEECPY